jgi:hypothetical protein
VSLPGFRRPVRSSQRFTSRRTRAARPPRRPEPGDDARGRDRLLHAGLPDEGRDTASPGGGVRVGGDDRPAARAEGALARRAKPRGYARARCSSARAPLACAPG